jgi:hypothetical protein
MDAAQKNYIRMYLTFHTSSPWRRHWCPDHRHPNGLAGHSWLWRHRHLPYSMFTPSSQASWASFRHWTKVWLVWTLSLVCGLLQCPSHKKRVSQPLARTATLEPYSMSPSHIVSSEEFLNLLAPELFFLILALPVYKMWIIQEPNKLELWNKLHFEEKKNGDYSPFLKYSVPIFVE